MGYHLVDRRGIPRDDENRRHEALSFVHARKTAAFEKLFLPHLDGAYNLALWIVERDQDAQAVVQEAYIQALKEFVEFDADARAWLLTIIRNTAYSWIEKRGNHSNMITFDEATHLAPSDKSPPEPSPEERQRHLHEALSKLPVEFREVLVLHEIEGWSYKQLASALKVSAATVISRLSRARQRLKQELAGVRQKELKDEL